MSRVIKFRAWSLVSEIMLCDDVVMPSITSILASKNHEVMQFTGLTDKNSVEIYEGDIVLVSGSGNCRVEICPYYGVTYIDFEGYVSPHADCVAELDYPEVIGNIYQNPELLNQ